jgi:NTP pyrophosphatase (non-canonical NTP hydrolase)
VARVREEVADVFLFSILVAEAFGIDLAEAAHAKIRRNAEKYPVEKARGRRDKYTKL